MNRFYRSIKLYGVLAVYLAFSACTKDSFDYSILKGADLKIDSVVFSAGSASLIADGSSELNFIIKAYSKLRVTINGVQTDSMVLIPDDRIADEQIKVYDNSGAEVGRSFSTSTATPSVRSFYAKVAGVQSSAQSVIIKTPGATYSKLVIPVVFHVFELAKTDAKRYSWYAELQQVKLEELVNGLNVIFNRLGTHAPTGANANVEFVLATTSPDGKTLDMPGHNTFAYASTFNWGWASANAATLIKNNAATLLWNPEKYLNVWVLPSAVFYGGLTVNRPAYTLSSTGLDGLNLQHVAAASEVPLTEPENVGLMLGRDEFNSVLRGPAPNLAYKFGTFYGLFQTYTYPWDPGMTDYCNDTQKFPISQFRDVYKKTSDGILFQAENIMDATYIDWNIEGGANLVSRVNTLTAEQVKRVRYVLENCPERMAWQ